MIRPRYHTIFTPDRILASGQLVFTRCRRRFWMMQLIVMMSLPFAFGCLEPEGAVQEAGRSHGVSLEVAPPATSDDRTRPAVPRGPPPEVAAELEDPSTTVQRVTGPDLIQRMTASPAKGTLVNAWASWCGPCRREFPMLVELQGQLAREGVDLIFVSVDEPESEAKALRFAQEHGVEPPLMIASRPLGPFKHALNPKWPGMLPATFLFDAEGRLRYFWGGPVYEEEIRTVIDDFLAGKEVDGESRFGLLPGKDYRSEP